MALRRLLRVTHWPWGTNVIAKADLALSLFYASKALFHPVFDRVVFSLVTLIPSAVGRNAQTSTLDGSNRCDLLR